uniref:Multiple epidermal growth factor-like domains protein 11 n=1 Tax=Crassostrea virginica TaxID=6565 RepID=A0A8B8AV03_CRAVI|nr:multiple epidermal growth factor-like domains protein 11 [Crassostrea virginica]
MKCIVFVFLCIFAMCYGLICSGPGARPVVCCSGYVWVDSSKSCEPCAVGFFGPKCLLSCGYPSYGEECQSTCLCSNELCHHVLGCFKNQHEVSISRLCSGRPSGLDCCTGYFWNSTSITCEPCNIGYHGPNCKEQCIHPSYGKDCQLTCNCSKESCSHVYGCHKSKVCDTGFTGLNCITPCAYPSYGKDCQLKCSCSNNLCHHVNGCVIKRKALVQVQWFVAVDTCGLIFLNLVNRVQLDFLDQNVRYHADILLTEKTANQHASVQKNCVIAS